MIASKTKPKGLLEERNKASKRTLSIFSKFQLENDSIIKSSNAWMRVQLKYLYALVSALPFHMNRSHARFNRPYPYSSTYSTVLHFVQMPVAMDLRHIAGAHQQLSFNETGKKQQRQKDLERCQIYRYQPWKSFSRLVLNNHEVPSET